MGLLISWNRWLGRVALAGVCVATVLQAPAEQVIEVVLVGGQSNAVGTGTDASTLGNPALANPQTDTLYWFGNSGDALANQLISLQPRTGGGFGPELALGQVLTQQLGSASSQVAIVKWAQGTTGFIDGETDTWHAGGDATLVGDGTLYASFQSTVNDALAAIQAANPTATVRVSGMVWMQGERDANFTEADALDYQSDLGLMVQDVRSTYGSDIVFVQGQLSNKISRTYLDAVQSGQASLAAGDARGGIVSTQSFSFNADNLHYDSAGQVLLGSAMGGTVVDLLRKDQIVHVVNVDFSRDTGAGKPNPGANPASVLYGGVGPAQDSGTTWNNAAFALTGAGDTVAVGTQFNSLIDSTGTEATAVSLTFTGDWYRAFNATNPGLGLQSDRVFTNGLDKVGIVTIGGLEADLVYDLYLIGNLNFDSTYRIAGTSQSLSDAIGKSADVIDENGDGSFEFSEGVSHVVFRGLTADANGNIVLEVQGNGQNFGLLTGLQLVARDPVLVPEPGSIMLLGLGALAVLRRRRRSN